MKPAAGTLWGGLAAALTRRQQRDPAAGLGDLEAALAGTDCPICVRAAGADERWLDHFLYEGYLEREPMRLVARAGGFCARHARRAEALGTSATVGVIYLALVAEALPWLAERRDRGTGPGPAAGPCEACLQASAVERREAFFLALLLRARGLHRYGDPALVCLPHLPLLVEQLAQSDAAALLRVHLERSDALAGEDAEQPLRVVLGPPPRLPAPRLRPREGEADDDDPVGRMRRRLRRLPGCAVCAEIADACAEWLGWLGRAATEDGDLSDVLPLCPAHVRQARDAAGGVLAPALAANVLREAGERIAYAAVACDAERGRRVLPAVLGRLWPGAVPPEGAIAALHRGRECPLCRRAREAGERALQLVAALLESAAGRRAFENGYGLCLRHARQAIVETPAAGGIVAATVHARLAVLRWELEEQLRRGAWQARPQHRGVESAAWLRAGARFAGTVDLNGVEA